MVPASIGTMENTVHSMRVHELVMSAFRSDDLYGTGRLPKWRGTLSSSIALASGGEEIEYLGIGVDDAPDGRKQYRGAAITNTLVMCFEVEVSEADDDAVFVVRTFSLGSLRRLDVRSFGRPDGSAPFDYVPSMPRATLVFRDGQALQLPIGSNDHDGYLKLLERLPGLLS